MSWSGQPNNEDRGWCLVEVMVATAAGAIVLGATFQSLSSFQRQFTLQQTAVAQQQDLRIAIELLQQELRLATPESLLTMRADEIEFGANIHGYQTVTTAPGGVGQSTLPVADGRGWPDRKTLQLCWSDVCERAVLARDGQAGLLTLTLPLPQAIPAGTSVSISNRVRYYSKPDDYGVLRLMRQVDGGAALLVGAIEHARFSYWDESGHRAMQPSRVRRIVIDVVLSQGGHAVTSEIAFRM